MDQTQAVQRPMPSASSQPVGSVPSDQMVEKKSGGWFKWVIIILAILIVLGLVYLFIL